MEKNTYSRHKTLYSCLVLLLALLVAEPLYSQRPKMYIKLYGGAQLSHLVTRDTVKFKDTFGGYMGGFGFRVSRNKLFGEINFDWVRTKASVTLGSDDLGSPIDPLRFDFRFNVFEIPITAGLIPVKKPAFKWYVYSGPVFRFNTKGKVEFLDEEITFKPKEVGLRGTNFDWRFGTQFDVFFFNIDLRYNVGMTNSAIGGFRINSHEWQFILGMLF